MAKRQFITQWTYVHKYDEPVDPVSLAVPGEAYTITELLNKFTRGVMPAVHQYDENSYDGFDEDIDINNPDPTRSPGFDLADALILRDEIQARKQRNAATQTKETSDITEPQAEPTGEASEGGTTEKAKP